MNDKNSKIKGYRLLSFITHKNLSDENIYSLVKQNNSNQLENVKKRVENFKYFMENLESASVVEMTREITKIKSDYLIIKDKDNKYLQLGIKNIGYEDVFETFLISSDNIYFKDTTINEKIVSIEKYNDNFELEPFSFREDNEKVEKIDLNEKENKSQNNKQNTKVQEQVKPKSSEMVRPSLLKRIKEKHNILNNDKELDKSADEKDKDKLKLKNKNER